MPETVSIAITRFARESGREIAWQSKGPAEYRGSCGLTDFGRPKLNFQRRDDQKPA